MERIHEGWLTKSPPDWKKGRAWKWFKSKWRQRYFVLYGPPASTSTSGIHRAIDCCPALLCYYDDEHLDRERGKIDLSRCTELVTGLDSDDFPHLFALRMLRHGKTDSSRTYFLAAGKLDDMNKWTDCLCSVLKLYGSCDELNKLGQSFESPVKPSSPDHPPRPTAKTPTLARRTSIFTQSAGDRVGRRPSKLVSKSTDALISVGVSEPASPRADDRPPMKPTRGGLRASFMNLFRPSFIQQRRPSSPAVFDSNISKKASKKRHPPASPLASLPTTNDAAPAKSSAPAGPATAGSRRPSESGSLGNFGSGRPRSDLTTTDDDDDDRSAGGLSSDDNTSVWSVDHPQRKLPPKLPRRPMNLPAIQCVPATPMCNAPATAGACLSQPMFYLGQKVENIEMIPPSSDSDGDMEPDYDYPVTPGGCLLTPPADLLTVPTYHSEHNPQRSSDEHSDSSDDAYDFPRLPGQDSPTDDSTITRTKRQHGDDVTSVMTSSAIYDDDDTYDVPQHVIQHGDDQSLSIGTFSDVDIDQIFQFNLSDPAECPADILSERTVYDYLQPKVSPPGGAAVGIPNPAVIKTHQRLSLKVTDDNDREVLYDYIVTSRPTEEDSCWPGGGLTQVDRQLSGTTESIRGVSFRGSMTSQDDDLYDYLKPHHDDVRGSVNVDDQPGLSKLDDDDQQPRLSKLNVDDEDIYDYPPIRPNPDDDGTESMRNSDGANLDFIVPSCRDSVDVSQLAETTTQSVAGTGRPDDVTTFRSASGPGRRDDDLDEGICVIPQSTTPVGVVDKLDLDVIVSPGLTPPPNPGTVTLDTDEKRSPVGVLEGVAFPCSPVNSASSLRLQVNVTSSADRTLTTTQSSEHSVIDVTMTSLPGNDLKICDRATHEKVTEETTPGASSRSVPSTTVTMSRDSGLEMDFAAELTSIAELRHMIRMTPHSRSFKRKVPNKMCIAELPCDESSPVSVHVNKANSSPKQRTPRPPVASKSVRVRPALLGPVQPVKRRESADSADPGIVRGQANMMVNGRTRKVVGKSGPPVSEMLINELKQRQMTRQTTSTIDI